MKPDNPIAIIQARMGSNRLPGKVLMPLAGKPALWHLVERLKYSKYLKGIVVATTVNLEDDIIVEFCKENNIKWYRGSEKDVLDRYYQTAKLFNADPIVRMTADCPAHDPTILDEVLGNYFCGNYDYYGHGGEFPDGLDCSCYAFHMLEDAWKNAQLPSEREHVRVCFNGSRKRYKTGALEKFKGLSHHRWTLDEESDYHFLQEIFNRLYRPEKIFLTQDILDLLKAEPQLMEINADIVRNDGYLKSLEEDKEYLRNITEDS